MTTTTSNIRRRDNATEIELGMSNFDHMIDKGFLEALQAEPAKVFGRHAGWNFNGIVWYEDNFFYEEVWHYKEYQETFSADSLEELMEDVNDKWGSE